MRHRLTVLAVVLLPTLASLVPTGLAGDTASGEGAAGRLLSPYHTSEEIVDELRALAVAYPDLVTVTTIGSSLQGRPIVAAKISDDVAVDDPVETEILLLAGQHGREPAGAEIVLRFANDLATGWGIEAELTAIVATREIWIVPDLNPDGRTFDDGVRGWRKNLRDVDNDGSLGSCDGVDINRNFGFRWGHDNKGSSNDPCAEDYRGTSAWSEPESRVLRDLAANRSFALSLNFHSFGELVLYPYGYADVLTPDDALFRALASAYAVPTGYRAVRGFELYPTNGETDDYLYATHGVRSLTIETGGQFVPAPAELTEIVEENQRGIRAVLASASIVLGLPQVRDAAVTVVTAPSEGEAFPIGTKTWVRASVRNAGSGSAAIPVDLTVTALPDGLETVVGSSTVEVAPGAEAPVAFPWTAQGPSEASFRLEIRAGLAGDTTPANDARAVVVRTYPQWGVDVDITPLPPLEPGTTSPLRIGIRNSGSLPDSFRVRVRTNETLPAILVEATERVIVAAPDRWEVRTWDVLVASETLAGPAGALVVEVESEANRSLRHVQRVALEVAAVGGIRLIKVRDIELTGPHDQTYGLARLVSERNEPIMVELEPIGHLCYPIDGSLYLEPWAERLLGVAPRGVALDPTTAPGVYPCTFQAWGPGVPIQKATVEVRVQPNGEIDLIDQAPDPVGWTGGTVPVRVGIWNTGNVDVQVTLDIVQVRYFDNGDSQILGIARPLSAPLRLTVGPRQEVYYTFQVRTPDGWGWGEWSPDAKPFVLLLRGVYDGSTTERYWSIRADTPDPKEARIIVFRGVTLAGFLVLALVLVAWQAHGLAAAHRRLRVIRERKDRKDRKRPEAGEVGKRPRSRGRA